MTRRTNTTKTTIYRRHAESCPIKDQPKNLAECECPLWIHGKVRGKYLRTSLDTRTLSAAERRRVELESGRDDDPTPGGGPRLVGDAGKDAETLAVAADEFLKTNNRLAANTKELYRRAVEHFCEWAASQELVRLRSINTTHIREYFQANQQWKRSTAQSHLIQLRVFFNYCAKSRRWIPFPPTQDRTLTQLNNKQKISSTRTPFAPAEVTGILTVIESLPEDIRDRTRALIYLLLYTGMRISDATFAERSCLTENNTMQYFVIKTGKQIDLAPELQQPAIDALAKLPVSRVYFFHPDSDNDYREARRALRTNEGEFSALMPQYDARIQATTKLIKRALSLAGLDGSCHRFRDTFAINLLIGGTDIYTVSKMLGHSDVKITDQHYMKLVPGYREKMSQQTRVLAYQFPKAG